MKNKNYKLYVAVAAIAVLLIAVVVINQKLSNPGDALGADNLDPVSAQGDNITVDNINGDITNNNKSVNNFDSLRSERESVRDLEIEYLDEIIATSASNSETLADAQEQKLAIVDNMEKEFTIESLIKAKGFQDVAVIFRAGSVNVIVDCESMTTEQVAQILDIVQRETGEPAGNIKIVPNKQ